ncbi:uncharacterized protein LOC124435242 [Xenia sp. Carnegie-2017]|uniref:uncharacterized protein LOC124435242 n=1 Tax=Xenia sp. Carnegie-2017 TaxID=2897299 RepID=UPI001F04DF2E|nr:uncharacterized protein LOC124435242 [Xenia sp. Carnegie-2017]
MAELNSDSESSHSSQCDSEYDYIPGYVIEDETRNINDQEYNIIDENHGELDHTVELSSWCKCGFCQVTLLQNPQEAWCCQELKPVAESLTHQSVLADLSSIPCCVTLHPGFKPVCLEKWSLKMAARKYKTKEQRRYKETGSENMFLRCVAYREFTSMIYGCLGEERRPLPACAYHAIRSKFNDKKLEFRGYEENEINE